LDRGKTPLPADIVAAQFHNFFDDKVAGVRSTTSDVPPPSFSPNLSTASFSQFQSVTVNDVIAAVRSLPDKTCALEPLPTTHLKAVVGVTAPFLTSLFNKSLLSGCVPEAFKVAYITQLVKKSGIDTGDVRSYRPISNLSARKNCSKAAYCVLRKVCFAATASISIQDRPLVRDCRALSVVRHSSRKNRCW